MDKNGFYTLSVPGRPLASHPRVSNCFLQGCPRGSQEREKHRARQRREEKRLGNRAFEGKKKSKGEGEEGRKRRARGWPLLQEIHHHNFTAHEAAVLCGALNSSGQYTLSSGIINTDVVAREQADGGLGVQLRALATMGSLLSVSTQRSPGRHPPEAWGPRGLSAGAE